MSSERTPLALRRAHLVAECARQRGDLADELNLLKAPVERIGGAAGFVREHRASLLAGVGVALGVIIARPKPVLGLVAAGASLWQMAQRVLPVVQMVRSRISG
jgi:hypothetical protein